MPVISCPWPPSSPVARTEPARDRGQRAVGPLPPARLTGSVPHSRTAPLVASAMKLRANRENTTTSGSTASSTPAITMA